MVLFSDLLHLALTASPGISSHGAAASGSALAGHDAGALPAFAGDIVQLHHTVKRARSIVEDRDATVHVPQQELVDIIKKLNGLEKQVASLLPADAKDDNKTDSDDQNCDVEHLLYSLGLNDTHSKRDQAIAAAQKQDISIGAAVKSPDKGDPSSSSPGVGDSATAASAGSPESHVAESAAAGVPTLGTGQDGDTAEEKAPDVDNGHKTTTITMTTTSQITITISRKHTATHPPDTATDIPTGIEVHDKDHATATGLSMKTKAHGIGQTETTESSRQTAVQDIDKGTTSELPKETKGKDNDQTANTEPPKETKVQDINEVTTIGLPTETKRQDNDKSMKTELPKETTGQDKDQSATTQVPAGTKVPGNDPAATTERPSETKAPDNEQTTPVQASTGAKDEHEAAASSVVMSESAQASSLSVSAPVSADDERTFSNPAVESMTADSEDEPPASITSAEMPPLVSSEVTPALTSENPTQTSSAGGAERLLAAHATPSGFITVATRAAKGAAKTTQ